jgi:hypothetical protein
MNGRWLAAFVMKTMGTGENSFALWASAREAKRMDTARATADFREVAPVPPLMEAMVALDPAFRRTDVQQEGRLEEARRSSRHRSAARGAASPPLSPLRLGEQRLLWANPHRIAPGGY